MIVGVLGGTFDPVHDGHLELAQRVKHAFRLPRMLMLLSARPPHKRDGQLADPRHREAMLRLALAGREGLELSTLELDRPAIGYTIDSLRTLRDGPPPCRPLFVLGLDGVVDLPTWREYRELLAEFDLIAVDRPDRSLSGLAHRLAPEVRARLHPLDVGRASARDLARLDLGRGGRLFHLPMSLIPVSSSRIRERAARGLDLGDLVPAGVARYILDNGLYRRDRLEDSATE